jgi:hypothetical protein
MKYFRPDLLARFGSRDEATALAAQEELEAQSEAYAKYLNEIRDKLPVRLRELQESYYLHDARVLVAWPPDYPAEHYGLPWNGLINWGGGVKIFYTPFASITLELDTPPKELLVLNYRQARITGWAPFELSGERTPYLEWSHDEIEIVEGKSAPELQHTILFSNGYEWQIWFNDFDFATLKPLAQKWELMRPGRAAG